MIQKVFKNSRHYVLLLAALSLSSFVLVGCGSGGGSDDYDAPKGVSTPLVDGQTSSVIIDVAAVEAMIASGKVNSGEYDNIVILQQNGYAAGHIPGAQEWSVSGIDRVEGPVLSGNMVLDGPTMDTMMQERGIKAGSTIVFMGNNSERVYFFFRYWGFPKEQLKILNGGTAAWTTAGNSLTTVSPSVTESDLCVNNLPAFNPNVRASLNEMIIGVNEQTLVPFATFARTTDLTVPKITETLDGTDGGPAGTGGFVFFQGYMLGQAVDPVLQAKYLADGSYNLAAALFNADGTYLSKADMEAYLLSIGIDGTKPIATFCRAGNLAATGFTPMDAVLDWDVMLYDGSWSQWASLTDQFSAVPVASWALPDEYTAWATDYLTDDGAGGEPFYLIDYAGDVALQEPYFYEAPASPYDSGANNIEDEDYIYSQEGSATSAPTGVSGGGGGGC